MSTLLTIEQLWNSAGYLRDSQRMTAPNNVSSMEYVWLPKTRALLVRSYVKGAKGQGPYAAQIRYFGLEEAENGINVAVHGGGEIILRNFDGVKTLVDVRCSCQDYRFTWWYSNKLKGYDTYKDFPPYEPTGERAPRNPDKIPGVCKHLYAVGLKAGK